jgi:toxin ParE1/3/4
MSRFRLSPLADRDLNEVADYLADRNPSAAVHELERLFQKFAALANQPMMGELRRDLPGNLRCFTTGNYVILYEPSPDGIRVARVVHAARDLGSVLRSEPS